MDEIWKFISPVLVPASGQEVGFFYLFWIVLFVLIHVVWDAFSPETEPFHLGRLKGKIEILYAAANFSTSLLLIIAVCKPTMFKTLVDITLPIIFSAITGMLVSLSALSPNTARLNHGNFPKSDELK
ncbi:MAG: hypothetical protein KIT00_05485 [Rhodospirillales bacterium]|nr:hypothetical protein [Rhodospirillales bacterium]